MTTTVVLYKGMTDLHTAIPTLPTGQLFCKSNRATFTQNQVIAYAGQIISSLKKGQRLNVSSQAEIVAYVRNRHKPIGDYSATT